MEFPSVLSLAPSHTHRREVKEGQRTPYPQAEWVREGRKERSTRKEQFAADFRPVNQDRILVPQPNRPIEINAFDVARCTYLNSNDFGIFELRPTGLPGGQLRDESTPTVHTNTSWGHGSGSQILSSFGSGSVRIPTSRPKRVDRTPGSLSPASAVCRWHDAGRLISVDDAPPRRSAIVSQVRKIGRVLLHAFDPRPALAQLLGPTTFEKIIK